MAEGNALYTETAKEMYRLRAENERLLEEAFDMGVDMTAMRDEIKRLRKALEKIRDMDYRGYPHQSAHIARKALEATDDS